MTTKPETLHAMRRLIAASDASITALRQVAELVDARDRPLAITLLSVADLLEGATQHATQAITHEPTGGDAMQLAAISSQLLDYAPAVRLPDVLAVAAVQ